MDIFHISICFQICCVFEKTKINEKEAGVGPFKKRSYFSFRPMSGFEPQQSGGSIYPANHCAESTALLFMKWSNTGATLTFFLQNCFTERQEASEQKVTSAAATAIFLVFSLDIFCDYFRAKKCLKI